MESLGALKNKSFKGLYKGKKILVTGHTGFKGSWLSIWLKVLGAEVIGYSLDPPSNPNIYEACGLKDKMIHISGDIRDYENLLSVLKLYKPDFVFHLAAQPLVRFSYREPRLTYETNVLGTVNLLEAVRKTDSVRVIINVTSDKCYENREWAWGYREDDRLGGHDPYSSSKSCAELVTSAWLHSYFSPEGYQEHGVALASVRAGNVIGGGDWGNDRLLTDCIKALVKGRTIVLRNPTAIRPWQFILEPLFGYMLLGVCLWEEGPKYVGAWNFGPYDNDIRTVKEVVEAVIKKWGSGQYKIDGNQNQPPEAHLLKLDCSKARAYLGWRPVYSLDRALTETIDWYRRFYEDGMVETMWNFTVGQITNYMDGK